MSDTAPPMGLPEAARHLGVTIRVLRRAIRAGVIPAPEPMTATAVVSPAWLESARTASKANPKSLMRVGKQKVPAFARYEGTSAWRKYTNRVRAFNAFRAAEKK